MLDHLISGTYEWINDMILDGPSSIIISWSPLSIALTHSSDCLKDYDA